ncbi:sulfatase-like hydrolase/transferase [Mameliella alba]|nr:sulfatase-like hydrolase/transferase [Antarctobacter heliothermus]MBY6144005.1 sulfatase-like hydrolase/transferase [Mameliella alba]MCA0954053.1 sulfatase-like hydrolase/transferase [Mameliella alba]
MTGQPPRNLLMIVIDQFRADLLTGPLADCVALPNLRQLSDQALWFRNHHTVTLPCGPARASLLTGQYAMSHRAVHNGTPLAADIPNLATELRRLGRELLLFGYTDIQPDPRGLHPNDPAHRSYTAPITGITEALEMREEAWTWLAHLRARGYDVPDADSPGFDCLYRPQEGRPGNPALYRAEDSDTAFLTDQAIAQLDVRKARPWSALLTYIRPHPPFVAPAPWHALADPAKMPTPVVRGFDHPFFDAFHAGPVMPGMFWGFDGALSRLTADQIAQTRATYLGLAAEVDHHIGRLLDWLDSSGQREDTMILLTADHGEMLGDLGLWGKQVPFRPASHVPLMIAHPEVAPGTVDSPTESIDVSPTVLAALGGQPPTQMQGRDLLGPDERPEAAVMVELELGAVEAGGRFETTWGRCSDQCRAVAFETDGQRLVHFASGHDAMLFDVGTDPDCRFDLAPERPGEVARLQARLLSHRIRALAPRC